MTDVQGAGFWSTAAQIAAVLLLTLVLEARRLGERWRKKRYYFRRFRRWVSAVSHLVVLVVLLTILFHALRHMWFGGASSEDAALAIFGLIVAAFLIVFPVLDPLLTALMDVFLPAVRRTLLAWFGRRELEAAEVMARAERFLRSVRVDALMDYADALILASRALRTAQVGNPGTEALVSNAQERVVRARRNVDLAAELTVPTDLREQVNAVRSQTDRAIASFDDFMRRSLTDATNG